MTLLRFVASLDETSELLDFRQGHHSNPLSQPIQRVRVAVLVSPKARSPSGSDCTGITVAYFRTEGDVRAWKQVPRHTEAQRLGREQWYRAYRVRVAKVEREYGWELG